MPATVQKRSMLTGAPGRSLLLFALPIILGNLFQQFYNITDSIVVGKFVGEHALAAVGSSYAITSVFIAVAIGGGIGSAVIISQYLGAGNLAKMKTAAYTTLLNFLGVSVVLGILGFTLNDQILSWVNVPPEVLPDASVYLSIYFAGLPFLFMYNVESSIFNSLGDSRTPLFLLVFSSLLNIGLDLLFVVVFGQGVKGVAIATLIAQGVSALISLFLLLKKLKSYAVPKKVAVYDKRLSASMIKIALPSILQQSIVQLGILLVQSVVNSFGPSLLAGYSAGMRIESLSIVPMLSLGNAMSTFTAQNIGAGQLERVKLGYRTCYKAVFAIGLFFCLLYQLFGPVFVSAFLDNPTGEAFSTGLSYVKFLSFFYCFIGLKGCTDGLLRGAGDVKAFTIANLVNLTIRVVVTNVFAPIYGIQVAWMAVPMGWAANYLISFSWYLTGKWKHRAI